MAPSREEILQSATPHPDFTKAASETHAPPLPSNIDIQTLRSHSNAAKAEIREKSSKPPKDIAEWAIEIPTRDGSVITAWVYGPSPSAEAVPDAVPIFIFFHGGGFCVGNRHDDFEQNRAIASRNGVVVVSVEYRLAPEYAFPTAVHDGVDALQWIAANARKIHKSASPSAGLIVGGTSAGGNIANAVVYLNRDQASPVPVTGQFLSVPPLLPPPLVPAKYRDDHVSVEQNKGISIPPPEMVKLFMGAYKPDLKSTMFSPFNHSEGMGGVPPAYLQACGVDASRDDVLIYERVLREEYSIPTRVDLYSGLPHHFWEFFPQLTEAVEKRLDDTIAGIQWLLENGKGADK